MTLLRLVPLVVLAACASADAPAPAVDSTTAVVSRPDSMTGSVDFRCADGREVRANYFVAAEPAPAPPYVLLITADTAVRLPLQASASGSRYADSAVTASWWTKGDSATYTSAADTTVCAVAEDVVF
jgi:membrane-bound inhibitor of C-type lysozyme